MQEHFPEEVSARWMKNYAAEQDDRTRLHSAIQSELRQVKPAHVLYEQQGGLFYPSDYKTIKAHVDEQQQEGQAQDFLEIKQ